MKSHINNALFLWKSSIKLPDIDHKNLVFVYFVYCSISPNLPETGISIAYSFVYIICFIWTGSLLDKTSFYRRWNQIWCFKLTLKYDKIYPTGSVKKDLMILDFFYLTLHGVRHFPHFQAFSIFFCFQPTIWG